MFYRALYPVYLTFKLTMFSTVRNKFICKNVVDFISKRNFSEEVLTKEYFDGGIQTITMAHPKTRNSLSIPMMQNLIDNLKKYQDDQKLRAIVLAAEGPVFSAGHNLKELTRESGKQQHQKVFDLASQLMLAIIDSPVPIIAKVDGIAAAAGCQLVAQCDMAVCSEKSKFSTPGANFGVFCSTPGIALARCMPKMAVLHMLFTGYPISAEEAKATGLVSKVCASDKLDEEVCTIVEGILSKSRSVIELGKRFFYKQVQFDIKKAYELGATQMVDNINLKDGQEGIKSFVEKRKANWSHSFNNT